MESLSMIPTVIMCITKLSRSTRHNYLFIKQEAPLVSLEPLQVGHGVGAEVQHQPGLGLPALGAHLLELEVRVDWRPRPLVEWNLLKLLTGRLEQGNIAKPERSTLSARILQFTEIEIDNT